MMFPDSLQTYLKILYDHDDLQRVNAAVDPELIILCTDDINALSNKFKADLESIGSGFSAQALSHLVADRGGKAVQDDNPEWKALDLNEEGLMALPAL
jgi:hypothetical protein